VAEINPDSSYLMKMVQLCISKGVPPATFFEIYLLPYFNDMGSGLNTGSGLDVRVGHFFYNLSSLLPLTHRARMPVAQAALGDERADLAYDNATRTIIPIGDWRNTYGEKSIPPRAHFSLEAWRKMWEKEQGGYRVPLVNVRTHQFDRYLGLRFPNDADADLKRIKDPPVLHLVEVVEDEEVTKESEEKA
jgi:hypothetical protein